MKPHICITDNRRSGGLKIRNEPEGGGILDFEVEETKDIREDARYLTSNQVAEPFPKQHRKSRSRLD